MTPAVPGRFARRLVVARRPGTGAIETDVDAQLHEPGVVVVVVVEIDSEQSDNDYDNDNDNERLTRRWPLTTVSGIIASEIQRPPFRARKTGRRH